jgi:hypothetical protein
MDQAMFDWLYTAVSWLLLRWHDIWAAVLPDLSSSAETDLDWVVSIVSLVFTIRLAFFPLYVAQLRAQRGMVALQPKIGVHSRVGLTCGSFEDQDRLVRRVAVDGLGLKQIMIVCPPWSSRRTRIWPRLSSR